ncbi:MAG: ornithine decarboxylase [Gammaproteobacteria bacterium CG_4_10_14_0_8_um_filter_38_16]|nr:MAG: ornithine decarboxylase [Gammaproteobacteria bacterium CG_4_10_14_0_8_um_filter_38_16]PJA02636.1 MAG: ornithine decarboxylase [Gammaproteobacteria bacterium CG_4_10_14_0_2_um_filter_38_22]PJB11092.1 MAG: ornithine decarboxylase [Gammaproteobacteria bacterium CG_4_9_14_3_um_filter_38_9]
MKLAEFLKSPAASREPFFAFRPHILQKSARYFMQHFSGKILYAIKTNPELHVLKQLYAEGIRSFELASITEIALVYKHFPDAERYFMNPVKSRAAIREAYFKYGVRHFSLDARAELDKILEETDFAKDLHLHVRLSIPNTYAEHSLAEKFGVNLLNAPKLIKATRQVAHKVGVCFHVGSQCMHPDAYRIAIRMTRDIINQLDFDVDSINVGGGFPSIYPGLIPPPLNQYFEAIHEEFEILKANRPDIQLLSEPGRALVAESSSLVVQVLLRKGDVLYINDGIYGAMFDAGFPELIYPVQLIRPKRATSNLTAYRLYGPTCDALDQMKGPFYLPNDVQEGDFIEVGQLGAYGRTLATSFNGFSHRKEVCVIDDDPLMTLYDTSAISKEPLEVIAA